MHETIISQLFTNPFEDFGKSPLTQTFILKAKATVSKDSRPCIFKDRNGCIKSLQIQDLLSWFCERPFDWCCVCWLMETEALQGLCWSCTQGGKTFLERERKWVTTTTAFNAEASFCGSESVGVIIPLSVLFLYPQQRQLHHSSCLFCNLATCYLSVFVSIAGECTYLKTK